MKRLGLGLLFFLFVSPVFAAEMLINEFLPNASQEWVEFYNNTDSQADLSNYFFDDDKDFNSDSESKPKISLSGLLSSHATCYLDLTLFLNNSGDSPTLFKLDATIEDTYTYASSSADKSYARVPDGGNWQVDQTPTKSSSKCSDLAPTSTPTPTPTNTPTSTPTQAPSATNTPTTVPTATPTFIPTKTPTKRPSPSLTPSETPILQASPTGEVLSVSDTEGPTPTATPSGSLQPAIISFALIGAGFGILALLALWQKRDLFRRLHRPESDQS